MVSPVTRALVMMGILAMVVLPGSPPVGAQAGFISARYLSGDLPVPPALVVSGGEVFLEVLVAVDGRVNSIRTLRTTPPFTDAVIKAVRSWQFKPAMEPAEPAPGQTAPPIRPVAGPVFVAAMFAPPVLMGPTLGQPPRDVLAASDETPVPIGAKPAAYPPRALGDGTVLVEVTINEAGLLTDAQIKVSSPAFDAAAMTAARSWSFRPARRHGNAVTTHAYLLFAFRQPVLGRG
jgi:TonB family protein